MSFYVFGFEDGPWQRQNFLYGSLGLSLDNIFPPQRLEGEDVLIKCAAMPKLIMLHLSKKNILCSTKNDESEILWNQSKESRPKIKSYSHGPDLGTDD